MAASSLEVYDPAMRLLGMVILSLGLFGAACKSKHGRLEQDDQLVCDSNNSGTVLPSKLVLTADQAKSWGAAFEASGNCDATIVNPEFRSPGVALKAGGNSRLVIQGGILEGGERAIEVSGNAQVEIQGTVILGKVKKSGHGKVIGMDTAKDKENVPEP